MLITGATGFIGRALGEKLAAQGWRVRGTVRSPGKEAGLPAGVEAVMVESVGPDTDWSEALAGVGAVVHLAARVHVMKETASDPLAEFRLVNAAGTENLARSAAQAGVHRLVFLSSIGVHGKSDHGRPLSEQDEPRPEDPYSASKWEAEQALHRVSRETGLETVILRPPLVYGPKAPGNFARLMGLVQRNLPLPLAGVKNRRSMIYIGNLVSSIITCLDHPGAAGRIFLVSDGEDVSTPELIRRMAAAAGRPARLFPFPFFLIRLAARLTGRSEDVERVLGSLTIDSQKISRDLGWKPPYTMAQGLAASARRPWKT